MQRNARRWFFFGIVIAGIVSGLYLENKNKLGNILIQVCNQVGTCIINPTPDSSSTDPPPNVPPSPKLSQQEYLGYVSGAKLALATMPQDMSIRFPLGTTKPLGNKESNNNPSVPREAIGYLDPSGKVMKITSSDIIAMLDQQAKDLYLELAEATSSATTGIAANISSDFRQDSRLKTINLIAYNQQTQKIEIIPFVSVNDVCRDALNSALNGELTENTDDLSSLRLNH